MHTLRHTCNTYIYHTSHEYPAFRFFAAKKRRRKDSLEPPRAGSRLVDRASRAPRILRHTTRATIDAAARSTRGAARRGAARKPASVASSGRALDDATAARRRARATMRDDDAMGATRLADALADAVEDASARNAGGGPGRAGRARAKTNGKSARPRLNDAGAHLRVLLATDDAHTRKMVESMLRELGVEVVAATNGNEVLDVLRGAPKSAREDTSVDMILLDVLMPELDGEVELVEACKANETLRGVPIVIMSTVDERKACKTRFENSGAAGFLTKPVNRIELKESLAHTRALKSHESGSVEGEGSGSGNCMDPNDNVGGSANSSLTKLTSREKVAGGSGGGQNDSGSDNQYNEKPLTRRAEAEAIDRWASREGGSGDCGSGGSGQGTGSGSGSHEGSGSGQRDPNDGEKFRGLSVQLIKAHGGATTMLELSLPEHASEHVVVRRSNSRSAFKGFQNYLKNENKDTAVQMMSVDLTQQHHSFYEASSMMPPSDFAKFYGPIMPKMEMPVPPPMPPYADMNQFSAAAAAAAAVAASSVDASVMDQSYMANPFFNVLQTAADHTQQTSSSQAAEHRAAAIRRFLKKRKERNFEKKVLYPSRQKLSESRPRVRGQFTRNNDETTTTTTTTENVSNGSDNKPKSNETNASEANKVGEVEGKGVDEYGHGSNEGSNEGSKEGSRSSSGAEGEGSK